ncbi:hypothetical protein FLA_3795 [Filimonas lacunae]|nr:hypothetical protein FLA_3795 [Filimonas lacunae]
MAAITKFIDVPVDKATGIPGVQIPLYSMKADGVTVPVLLSYHAGGIKVGEAAGSVGLGWSLQADGFIARAVRGGGADEYGYYYNKGFAPIVPQFDRQLNTAGVDLEPDIYSFSFNGYSGKFLFDKQRRVQLIPEQDLLVESGNIGEGFTITTPDGAKYFFGNGLKDYSRTYGDGSNVDLIPVAWHLYKIITPNNRVITFEYTATSLFQNSNLTPTSKAVILAGGATCAECSIPGSYTNFDGYVIKKIASDLCEINFNYQTALREDCPSGSLHASALDNISITDKTVNSVIKSFRFTTSYFISTDNYSSLNGSAYVVASYLQKRLRLDELQEVGADGTTLPPYKFYYNKHNSVSQLPNKLSTGQDHWGFYNGQSSNKCLIGNYSIYGNNCNNLAKREVNTELKKAYALDEVMFPAGGYTIFEFDNNTGPGLRIKRLITRAQRFEEAVLKEYTYTQEHIIGGEPLYAQSYDLPINQNSYAWEGTFYYDSDDFFFQRYIAFSNPTNYGGELSGNYSIYEKVTEQLADGSRVESYYATDNATAVIDQSNLYPLIYRYTLLDIGKPYTEKYLDKNDFLVKQVDYTYNAYYRTIINLGDAARDYKIGNSEYLRYYYFYTGYLFPVEKKETTYSHDLIPGTDEYRSQVMSSKYEYDGIPASYKGFNGLLNSATYYPAPTHLLQTGEITNVSDGQVLTKRARFVPDYAASFAGAAGTDVFDEASLAIKRMYEKHRYNAPVEAYSIKTKDGTDKIIAASLTRYADLHAEDPGKEIVVPVKKQRLSIASPISYTASLLAGISKSGNNYQFSAMNAYEEEAVFSKYGENAQLLEYTGKDKVTHAFLWGYSNYFPVADVVNSSYGNIFYTGFEELQEGYSTTARTGKKSKLNGFQQSLTGLSNGKYVLSYWLYVSGNWQLSSQNITVSNGAYTISLSGQVDDVRFAPQQSMMKTYTYDPLVNMSSETNENNQVKLFEHDGMGRLHMIKDDKNNIEKVFAYNYGSVDNSNANYQATGVVRCRPCVYNTALNSYIQERELKDINAASSTYNQTYWEYIGYSATACASASDWAVTSTPLRCKKDANNNNNGLREREYQNINKCSDEYGNKKWEVVDENVTACPLPVVYAKIYIENEEYYDYQQTTTGEIIIRFYSDAACTQPYAVNGLTVSFRSENSCTGTVNYTRECNNEMDYLFDGYTNYLSYLNSSNVFCNVKYYLNANAAYVIVN